MLTKQKILLSLGLFLLVIASANALGSGQGMLPMADETLPVLLENQLIKMETPAPRDYFGREMAIDGDTLAISKGGSSSFRSINLYQHNGAGWQFVKAVSPFTPPEEGSAPTVALDGDILLFGDPRHDGTDECTPDGRCGRTGLVYVFERNAGGANNWGLVTTLNGGHKPGALFGSNVVLDGNIAAISAPSEDGAHEFSGAIYMFERLEGGNGDWEMVQRLEYDHPFPWALYGAPVFLAKNTLVTGVQPLPSSNEVLIYDRPGGLAGQWTLTQRINFPVYRIYETAFDGTTLVYVGLNEHTESWAGLATYYFYERNDAGTWVQVQTLEEEVVWDGSPRWSLKNDVLVMREHGGELVARLFARDAQSGKWGPVAYLGKAQDAVPENIASIAVDGNHVLVGGTSELDDREGEVLAYELGYSIDSGHAGAWFNPDTAGQGVLIDVEPASQFMFLAWFAFTGPDFADPNEQHWFTAQGDYSGNSAELILYETLGGQFDDPQQVSTNPVGTINVSFADCATGTLDYTIDTWGLQGSFPLVRVIPGTENVCMALRGSASEWLGSNDGWDGAWFDDQSPGQGFLIDVLTDPSGDDFIFAAWFTYGENNASGQRWLTAQGPLNGSTAEIPVYETTGGSFDNPGIDGTTAVGSMTIEFISCNSATVTYSLSDDVISGSIDIERVIPGTEVMCEELREANN